jgi:hypothetical protein
MQRSNLLAHSSDTAVTYLPRNDVSKKAFENPEIKVMEYHDSQQRPPTFSAKRWLGFLADLDSLRVRASELVHLTRSFSEICLIS